MSRGGSHSAWQREKQNFERRTRSEPKSRTLESFLSPRVKEVLGGGAAVGDHASVPARKKRITPTLLQSTGESPRQWSTLQRQKPGTDIIERTNEASRSQPSPVSNIVISSEQVEDAEDVIRVAVSIAAQIRSRVRLDLVEFLIKSSELSEIDVDVYLKNPSENALFLFQFLSELDVPVLANFAPSALHTLASNESIATICPAFKTKLFSCLEKSNFDTSRPCLESRPPSMGVSYRPDFDGRIGFISEKSFASFKKQRDAFFRLHQTWKESSNGSESHSTRAFTSQVDALLALSIDAENHVHLAELFVTQLHVDLRSSVGEEASPRKKSDATKLRLLQERMVASKEDPEIELKLDAFLKFYEAFLNSATAAGFRDAVTDALLNVIHDLMFEKAGITEEIQGSSSEDTVVADELLKCLAVLGKVLGFAYFGPKSFASPKKSSSAMDAYCRMRRWRRAGVAVEESLSEAMRRGHLLEALVWLTHFLRFVDPSSARDPYYQRFFGLLRGLYECLGDEAKPVNCRCGVEWNSVAFFQLSTSGAFCATLLISWMLTAVGFSGRSIVDLCSTDFLQCPNCDGARKKTKIVVTPLGLIAMFSPWKRIDGNLRKLASVLVSKDPGTGKRVEVRRKITPLTQAKPVQVQPFTQKADPIQMKLEQDFFRNQPPAVKKLVDFGSEILASIIVRKLRERTVFLLEEVVGKKAPEAGMLDSKALASIHCVAVQRKAWKSSCDDVRQLAAKAVPLLLPHDASDRVKTISVTLICRAAFPRVFTALEEIVTSTSCELEFRKLIRNKPETPAVDVRLRTSDKCAIRGEVNARRMFDSAGTPSPSDCARSKSAGSDSVTPVLSRNPSSVDGEACARYEPASDNDFQRFFASLPRQPLHKRMFSEIADGRHSGSFADSVISAHIVARALLRGQDLTELGVNIETLSSQVDELLPALTRKPAAKFAHLWLDVMMLHSLKAPSLPSDLITKLVTALSKILKAAGEKAHLFACKHMVLLMSATDAGWQNWESLFTSLLRANLISVENFESEALSLLSHSWPPEMLTKLSSMLSRVSQCPEVRKNHSMKLVDWVAWFCSGKPDELDS